MLVQKLAQPQGVLETTVATLPEEGDHGMARVPEQDHLSAHCPRGSSHCAENACRISGDLAHHGLQATDIRQRLGVVFLAESRALLSAFGCVTEGLKRVLGPFIVHVDGSGKGTIPIGKRHKHVLSSRPDVETIAAVAWLAAVLPLGTKIVLPRVREQNFLVAPRDDVLGEGCQSRAIQSIACPRPCPVTRDDRAKHPEAQMLG
mmetsp:Transcript_123444/g.308472  ORF Transcript_123444/g.308472 Transcript_123444/m.308472 type:complete len:204 (+) Transcript_123444:555-1166(+)